MTDDPVAAPAPISIAALEPRLDEVAAAILAPCGASGTVEGGRMLLAQARADPDCAIYGFKAGDELLAVYALRKIHLANEIAYLAVAEGHRRQGHGRACLHDALLRSGKRPLVVEVDDATLGFYQKCGFKLVGKRRGADGTVRYRLGWHAPMSRRAANHDEGRSAGGAAT